MPNQYRVKQSDPTGGLVEGATVVPYYEDDNEIIIHGSMGSHHIRKNGEYFAKHLEPIGGK
ncbi:hypothetical protein [Cohnella yongneupensis]|uniref:Uncharacterized protein n=1 Tax=Cohnella yongneupensis TaxID=425006 RepID=A0ABW0QUE2_9BACL